MLLLHCFDDGLLGDFPATEGFSGGGSHNDSLGSIEGSMVEVSVWLAMASAGWTEVCKLVAFYELFVLLLH